MDIHQMQVRYDAHADRILWQVRTQGGEIVAAWLTRRMLRQLWEPFKSMVAQTTLPTLSAQPAPPGPAPQGLPRAQPALLMPEARDMLVQAARERPLPNANFQQAFNPKPAAQPLGAEPLLPHAADLTPASNGQPGLSLRLREQGGRSMSLQMNADLSSALMRLLEDALVEADWGWSRQTADPAAPAAGAAPRVLN